MPVTTFIVQLLGVRADWTATLGTVVGTEFVEAANTHRLVVLLLHEFLPTQIITTIKTAETV